MNTVITMKIFIMNHHKKTLLLLSLISLMILGGCVVEPLPPHPYYESTYSPVVYDPYPYYPYYGHHWGWDHHHHWR